MKKLLPSLLFTAALVVSSLLAAPAACAGDTDLTYTVAEGASPWFDRLGQWSLTSVPDSLKGSGPLPQGSCSSRSLDVPGTPASILVGVQTNDATKFIEKFPAAKDTGSALAIKNAAGDTTMPYTIFSLPNPPAHLDGAGVFGAGLMLLKTESGQPAPAATPSPVAQPSASPRAGKVNHS